MSKEFKNAKELGRAIDRGMDSLAENILLSINKEIHTRLSAAGVKSTTAITPHTLEIRFTGDEKTTMTFEEVKRHIETDLGNIIRDA